jgi:thioredoxin-like negative regulator of GroEL
VTGEGREPWPEADPVSDLAGFRPAMTGGVTARFGASQASIVRSLVSQVIELVSAEEGPGQPGPRDSGEDELAAQLGLSDNDELPADPILARLLPDAYAEDPDASAEFRRYTELGLRSGKVAAAQTVLDTLPAEGGKVRLKTEDAQAWLRALNDVRLSLGVVLGVTDDFEEQLADLSADDPRAAYVGVYQWLGYLQESLVESLE